MNNIKKTFITLMLLGTLLLISNFVFNTPRQYGDMVVTNAWTDYKNSTYTIEGTNITLTEGVAETLQATGSASKVTTRYFGNDLVVDLNNDGKDDKVFLVTQETGGSGVFYYTVAALKTDRGYVGSDGYFLGDRIAPQTIETSTNPRHKNVVVVNYAERAKGDPMTTPPSVGKSVYLKLDEASMKWGIVEPNFEGEAR